MALKMSRKKKIIIISAAVVGLIVIVILSKAVQRKEGDPGPLVPVNPPPLHRK